MLRPASLLLAVACIATAGCKSTGVDQASSVGTGLRATATELDKSKAPIDNAVNALGRFDAKGDLKAQYKAYGESLDALESKSSDLRSLRANLKSKEDDFVKSWQESQATITNPDLRKKSEERKNELVARLAGIGGKADAARATYDSMMKDLRDAQSYLGHDLTQTGIDAVSGTRKSAEKSGTKLKEQIDELVKETKKLADDVDVPAPPPPPAPAPAKS